MGNVLGVVFVLIVIGVLLEVFKEKIDPWIRKVIFGIVLIVVAYWLLTLLGPVHLPGRG